jgi:hypothetical protein
MDSVPIGSITLSRIILSMALHAASSIDHMIRQART